MKIYLAGPWFTKAQAEREDRIKHKLRELGFDVFSPKEAANITGTDASIELRKKAFDANINSINDVDILFAICDGKECIITEKDQCGKEYNAIDSGTMVECGYAYALKQYNKNKPLIIYYAETLKDKPFNLMLAQSADFVITDFNKLNNLQKLIENNEKIVYNGIIE